MLSASIAELASSCTRTRRRAREMARADRETAAGGLGKRGIGNKSLPISSRSRLLVNMLPALGSSPDGAGKPAETSACASAGL